MSHIKNLRYTVGMIGFLSIGLYLILTTFGRFSVSEAAAIAENPAICGGLVYLGTLLCAVFNNANLTSEKPDSELTTASAGIVFYVLFLAVEWLTYGAPVRGVLHGVLPVFGLMIPAAIALITKK